MNLIASNLVFPIMLSEFPTPEDLKGAVQGENQLEIWTCLVESLNSSLTVGAGSERLPHFRYMSLSLALCHLSDISIL